MAQILTLLAFALGLLLTPVPAFTAQITVPVSDGGESAEDVSLYTQSYALVIGIDDYTGGWPRLNNAVKDARLIATALKDKGFTVTLIENPGGRELDRAIEEFFVLRGENPDDRLFLWFAGHGHTENGEGYLIPADGLAPEEGARFRLSAIRLRDINTYVRLAQSKHVYAIFDACFAGTIFDSRRARPPAAITRAAIKPVRQFMTSGDAYQTVSDDGSFRELFLRALDGEEQADLNKDGFLTASELGFYMGERVTNLTEGQQTPRYGKLRDKNFDQGDFIFALPGKKQQREEPGVQPPPAVALTPFDKNLKQQMELSFWDSIKNSQDPADFEDFIASFPNGTFTAMAHRRLARLNAPSQETTPPAVLEEEVQVAAIDPQAATARPAEQPEQSVKSDEIPKSPDIAPAAASAGIPEEPTPLQKSIEGQFSNYTPGTLLTIGKRDPNAPELPPGVAKKTAPGEAIETQPEEPVIPGGEMLAALQSNFPDYQPGVLLPVSKRDSSLPQLPPGDTPKTEPGEEPAAETGSDPDSISTPSSVPSDEIVAAIQKSFPDFVPGSLEPVSFSSHSDINTVKDTAVGGTCATTEDAMRAPIDALFQSWEQLAVEPYMSQWASDAVQYKLSGDIRNMETLRRVREGLFPLLKSVSVERADMSLLDAGQDFAVFENIYTMEFRYKSGRVVREENDLETYMVSCDSSTGRWLIAENTDLPNN